jgi:hypothetical protein
MATAAVTATRPTPSRRPEPDRRVTKSPMSGTPLPRGERRRAAASA